MLVVPFCSIFKMECILRFEALRFALIHDKSLRDISWMLRLYFSRRSRVVTKCFGFFCYAGTMGILLRAGRTREKPHRHRRWQESEGSACPPLGRPPSLTCYEGRGTILACETNPRIGLRFSRSFPKYFCALKI